MAKLVMLTTSDNPYDPHTQFDDWYKFDIEHGYNTCGYLSRIAKTSNALSDSINNEEIERAIDEIVKMNLTGTYVKKTYDV